MGRVLTVVGALTNVVHVGKTEHPRGETEMATVNHVGPGMIGLSVFLAADNDWDDTGEGGLTGKVTSVRAECDWIEVTWANMYPPQSWYECEKFETKMVDDTLTLVLNLD